MVLAAFAFLIGFIALVVAVMALPFWDKPKLHVFFDCAEGYKLWCWIRNIPIKSRVLIWMGYERRCQNIDGLMIAIKDQGGGIVSLLNYGATHSNDIRLGIVEIKSKYDGRVFLKDEFDKFGNILKVGSYTLELKLWDNGRQLLKKKKHIRVNPTYPFIEWLSKM